jgi:purine-binding chemotaxis protein CheW
MDTLQYLTFYIADEVFALEVLKIKEIIPYNDITPIPLMKDYIEGVMNIRGNVVPIIDLSKRVELDKNSATEKLSIIIISLDYGGDTLDDVGIIVTQVDKVFSKENSTLESSPTFGSKIKKDLIKNIAKVDDSFIPILDIEKILDLDDLSETLQEVE